MRIVFLRGQVPPASEHPEKLFYNTIDECEDMWSQLFYHTLSHLAAEGELVYQGGDMTKVLGSFEEKWVPSLKSYIPENKPDVIICRGGFDYYDSFLKSHPDAKKIYYGAGLRYFPKSDFKDYNLFLTDDPRQAEKVSKKTEAEVGLLAKPAASLFSPRNVEKEFDLCYMANFTRNPTKRFDKLLTLLKDSGLKTLAIGNIEKNHKDLAKQLGISIEFRDWVLRKDLPSQISRCSVGVCSSDYRDSCPRVIPEFLACGLPVVIADDLSIWQEKYITPETGLCVPINEFANSLKEVLSNVDRYNARAYYEQNLSLNSAADRLAMQIRHIVKERI